MAFSPDGRTSHVGGSASSSASGTLRTGKLLRKLDQGFAGVLTLDFSPDGRYLAASASSPWPRSGTSRPGPDRPGPDGRTRGRRRSTCRSDGRDLLVTHGNGQGAIWDLDPESWAQRACAIANRTLTREEWEEFLPGRPYEPACGG